MWIEKLWLGVLRVLTPIGPRYIRPTMSQRVYLLWIFRHFEMLPLQVLSARQQRMIDGLCGEHRFVSSLAAVGLEDAPVLGTVEWRSPAEVESLSPKRPSTAVAAVIARVAARAQQRS
jgi:hypothetical protein